MDGIPVESFLRVGFSLARADTGSDERTPSPATLRKWFGTLLKRKEPVIGWDRISVMLSTHAARVIQKFYRKRWRQRNHEDVIQLYLSF